ncbi:MAG: CoA pyrophosphatase, partial [Deltaproteobacteria bacterium]|nr:CoA pyrophosphatase [Deltaproteobacteria bacterium]
MTNDLIPAAVLIPFITTAGAGDLRLKSRNGPLSISSATKILLTVRSHAVEHHKGQISFPGGVFEPSDMSLEDAALRESHEEIGLPRDQVEIVAELPQVPTVATRFQVTPFVGLVHGHPQFQPNPAEIGQIIFVPLHHLLNPANSVLDSYNREGLTYQFKTYNFGPHRIWGATG